MVFFLFTNKIVYPKKEPKITFNQSLSLFDEKKIKKILNSRNIPKIKFNFTNSNFLILETTGTTTVKKLMLAKANEYLMGCYHSKNIFKYNKLTKILHCLPIYYNAG